MSAVGVVSIALGVLSVCARGYSLVAPAVTLHWLRKISGANGPIRKMGAVVLAVGATLIWAGSTEETGLAGFLTLFGWAMVGMSTTLMVLFPGAYRAILDRSLFADEGDFLIFVRVRSLLGIIFGAVLIYFGVRAL